MNLKWGDKIKSLYKIKINSVLVPGKIKVKFEFELATPFLWKMQSETKIVCEVIV